MTAPISNGPTTHGYTTMRDATVFGETDGTIARQKHPFSALSWRAKASRVSRKRTEVLALVLTVSSRRASSSFGAKKFALLGLTWV